MIASQRLQIEIGRMLLEGVSDEGIKLVVDDWNDSLHYAYAAYVEYGVRPESKVVEGSVIHPITDEAHLLSEKQP